MSLLAQYADVDIERCDTSSPSSRTTSSSSSTSSMTSANAGSEPAAAVNKTNLIVNYLPQTFSQDDMMALFSSVAPVDSCKLVRDKTTGTCHEFHFHILIVILMHRSQYSIDLTYVALLCGRPNRPHYGSCPRPVCLSRTASYSVVLSRVS